MINIDYMDSKGFQIPTGREIVSQCFQKVTPTHFVDKMHTGNGFTTGFLIF